MWNRVLNVFQQSLPRPCVRKWWRWYLRNPEDHTDWRIPPRRTCSESPRTPSLYFPFVWDRKKSWSADVGKIWNKKNEGRGMWTSRVRDHFSLDVDLFGPESSVSYCIHFTFYDFSIRIVLFQFISYFIWDMCHNVFLIVQLCACWSDC